MRKEKLITIIDDGNELMFKIKQMSAIKQERWINKVLILLSGGNLLSGIFASMNKLSVNNVASKFKNLNLETLADMLGNLDYDKVEPLYNELLECCSYIPDHNNTDFATPLNAKNADSVIGEVKTLYKLRMEALKINFSFFNTGAKSPNQKKADITITKHM